MPRNYLSPLNRGVTLLKVLRFSIRPQYFRFPIEMETVESLYNFVYFTYIIVKFIYFEKVQEY